MKTFTFYLPRWVSFFALTFGAPVQGEPVAGIQECPLDVLPDELRDVGLSEASQIFLDDFGTALRRFKGMSLDEFVADYGPKKRYLKRSAGAFVRSDCNGDGTADISDVTSNLAFQFLGTFSPGCVDACDSDDNGANEVTDAIYLLVYLFQGGPAPPEPFDSPGEDPTADQLGCQSPEGLGYEPMEAQNLDLIFGAYPPTEEQEAAFRRNGYVILENGRYDSFLNGLYDVFDRHLPVYVSVDSMLDALHLSFDRMLESVEKNLLFDQLDQMLTKMEAGLEELRKYDADDDDLEDVGFWICTARSLLNGSRVACRADVAGRVDEFLEYVSSEKIHKLELFEAEQCIDFSQFRPRGHYTRSEKLEKYFRAMMWVQRIGMKFAQHPRHAAVAFLLTRCLYDTNAVENWELIDAAVEALVGVSDSLNPPRMRSLTGAAQADIDSVDVFEDRDSYLDFVRTALETGAGRQLINSQILMSNPTEVDGFTPIPPAFHLMGQRFIVDSFVFTNVVFDRVRIPLRRYMPSPLDAMFVLGNRATVPLLREELEIYQYHPHLAALDWIVSRYPDYFWNENLYNVWLSALRDLNTDTTSPLYPPVMRTRAWEGRVLNTQLASWAHLRHDTVLYAKQSFTGGDCHYPDAWVDPYPDFFLTLARFADEVLFAFEELELDRPDRRLPGLGGIRYYLSNLKSISERLAQIAQLELDQDELSEEQLEFINQMIYRQGTSGGEYFDGWYTRLIYNVKNALPIGEPFDPTVADVHTDPNHMEVLHVGVGHPNVMVISIENGCGLKAYAGPVLSYHEFKLAELQRMRDEEWREILQKGDEPPRPAWTREFLR